MRFLNSYIKYLLLILMATILSSCGGKGSCLICSQNNDSSLKELSLEMAAPSQYPARKTLDIPILVTNTGNTVLNNIVYSIPASSNTTDDTLTITKVSQSNCATIAIGQTCQLTVQTSTNSKPGAFKVLAHNNQLNAEPSVFIGLIDIPPSTGVGTDGIALLYNTTLVRDNPTEGKLYDDVLITMVVTSENVGQFNTIQILDSNDNVLPYEVLTGNSGKGMTNLTIGSVVTLAVKIPTGSTQLVFKPILKSDDNEITNGDGQNQVIDVIPPTVKKPNLNILTPIVNLNESGSTQTITIVNNGNIAATSFSIDTGEHITIINNTCGSIIAANSSCSYTVQFDVNNPTVGTTFSQISYVDGSNTIKKSSTINYEGKMPLVGLTLSSNNFNYTFNATTESPIYASVVTITNAGKVLPLTLANLPIIQYFDISTIAGTQNDCTANQVLQPGASCNILVTYNNTIVSSGIIEMSVGYNYTGIDNNPKTANTSVNLNYNILQSAAVLSYDDSDMSYNFNGITNNDSDKNKQTITITNIGQNTATSVNVIAPTQPYNIISNYCGSTIARGASCQLLVQFGPVSSSNTAGTKTANLLTNYLPYSSATATASVSAVLSGNVYIANTAILNNSVTSSSGFSDGNGSVSQPYQIQNNDNNGTVTYTLTNSGETSADNFYVSYNANVLLPWSITNNNCGTQQNPVSLAGGGGSCNITFALNASNIGSNNLNFANIQMNWVDQDSPNGETQAGTSIVYSNVFASPTISAGISPAGLSYFGESTFVTFTLSGGYNVNNQLVSVTGSTPNDGNLTYPNGNSCIINHTSSTCSVEVGQSITGIKQSYTLSLSNAGSVPLINTSVNLDVVATFYPFGSPRQIAVNKSGTGVFITSPTINVVTYCDIINNNLINCITSGTGFSYPFGITIDKSGTYAFVANFSGGVIARCIVSGKLLTNCINSNATLVSKPYWLNFDSTGNYIFFGNSSFNSPPVSQCSFSGGNLNNCNNSGANLNIGMNQVTTKAAGDYSFVTNYTNSSLNTCSTNGGNLSNCVNSGATGLSEPVYLVLNSTETYAFISNYTGNSITQCSVNGGTLSNCSNSGATNLSGPEGMYLNSEGNQIYITNINNNTIIRCNVSGNRISNCKRTGFN